MSTRDIIFDIADKQGWNTGTMLDLALRYIENQQSDEAFRDFLLDVAAQENVVSDNKG